MPPCDVPKAIRSSAGMLPTEFRMVLACHLLDQNV